MRTFTAAKLIAALRAPNPPIHSGACVFACEHVLLTGGGYGGASVMRARIYICNLTCRYPGVCAGMLTGIHVL